MGNLVLSLGLRGSREGYGSVQRKGIQPLSGGGRHPCSGGEGMWSCSWEVWVEEHSHVLGSQGWGVGWGMAWGTLPSIPLTPPCSGQQD